MNLIHSGSQYNRYVNSLGETKENGFSSGKNWKDFPPFFCSTRCYRSYTPTEKNTKGNSSILKQLEREALQQILKDDQFRKETCPITSYLKLKKKQKEVKKVRK
jgi:hypothetical protein